MNPAGRRWWLHVVRRRWRALLVLALLTGLAGGVATTAVTGAHRSTTAVREVLESRRHADVMVLPALPALDWDAIVARPYVTAYGLFAATGLCLSATGGLEQDGRSVCTQPPIRGGWYDTIGRYDLLDGRPPTGPLEIAINRRAQQRYGWGVGQRLQVEAIGRGRLDDYWTGRPRGDGPWGPTYETVVTAVVEGADDPWRVLSGGIGHPGFIMSRAFMPRHGHEIEHLTQAFLRLQRGERDIARLRRDSSAVAGGAVLPMRNVVEARRRVERGTRVEAAALLLFAAAVAISALVLVGQALSRLIGAAAVDAGTLRSLGMTPRELRLTLAAPGITVAAAGAVGAGGVALALSPLVPIGVARSFDPRGGIVLDPVAVAAGPAVVLLTIGAFALGAAVRAGRQTRSAAPTPGVAVRSVGWLPLPTTVALGVRFALERRVGSPAVAVGPALLGAVVAVLAVTAALVVREGVDRTLATPAHAGQTWDLAYHPGLAARTIAADPDVSGGARVTKATADLGGVPVAVYRLRPLGLPLERAVLTGRAPRATDEIALGPATARGLGVAVGDRVAAGPDGTRPVRVVGIALLWEEGGHAAYDEGAWATDAGARWIGTGEPDWQVDFLTVRNGADADAVDARLRTAGGERDLAWPRPAALDSLETTHGLPGLLAAFLALLGVGALAHTLVGTVHGRRHDLAIVRALGLPATGARRVLAWQATAVGAIGVAIGVPLGLAVGELAWRVIATSMPVVHVSPGIPLAVLLVAPVTLLVVNALALGPARRAVRGTPARALRRELRSSREDRDRRRLRAPAGRARAAAGGRRAPGRRAGSRRRRAAARDRGAPSRPGDHRHPDAADPLRGGADGRARDPRQPPAGRDPAALAACRDRRGRRPDPRRRRRVRLPAEGSRGRRRHVPRRGQPRGRRWVGARPPGGGRTGRWGPERGAARSALGARAGSARADGGRTVERGDRRRAGARGADR